MHLGSTLFAVIKCTHCVNTICFVPKLIIDVKTYLQLYSYVFSVLFTLEASKLKRKVVISTVGVKTGTLYKA